MPTVYYLVVIGWDNDATDRVGTNKDCRIGYGSSKRCLWNTYVYTKKLKANFQKQQIALSLLLSL